MRTDAPLDPRTINYANELVKLDPNSAAKLLLRAYRALENDSETAKMLESMLYAVAYDEALLSRPEFNGIPQKFWLVARRMLELMDAN